MTESNRSLERGLAILDCFKPGVAVLSHGDLVERTGLPKATVTRLTTALRRLGYLTVADARGFRVGVPVLSLARSYHMGSALLQRLSPVIRRVARATASIVGVAAAHRTDMVYLEQVNCDPTRSSRQVGAGQRLPIAASAIGRAYLGGLTVPERTRCLDHLREADPQWSRTMEREVRPAGKGILREGRQAEGCDGTEDGQARGGSKNADHVSSFSDGNGALVRREDSRTGTIPSEGPPATWQMPVRFASRNVRGSGRAVFLAR